MFENILHQPRVVEQLSQDLREGTLPASLLFHGPSASAKLTTALELARALSCKQKALWNCQCESCTAHRTMDYPWLLLVGHKNFLPEIQAASDLLSRHGGEPRRFLLLRAVKKLVKRFDPVLWEGEEAKIKTLQTPLTVLQEEMELLHPPRPLPSGKELETSLKKILEASKTLAGALPSSGVPIHMVRKFSFWARNTSQDSLKFVLLENADKLQEGARNSLLKILEEPPAGVYFILLTSQRGAIMPTILSRVRPFAFAQRTPEQEKDILAKLFLDTKGDYENLGDYFQAFENEKEGLFRDLVGDFLAGLESPVYPLEGYGKFWTEGENFHNFLQELLVVLQEILLNKPAEGPLSRLNLEWMEAVHKLVKDTVHRREHLNLSASLLIETLFYQARALR